MAGRQIAVTKSLKDLPVSSMMKEPFIMNEQAIKPIKTTLDKTKTPYNRQLGHSEVKDFVRYSRPGAMQRNASTRIPIRAVTDLEKVGPKYGKAAY